MTANTAYLLCPSTVLCVKSFYPYHSLMGHYYYFKEKWTEAPGELWDFLKVTKLSESKVSWFLGLVFVPTMVTDATREWLALLTFLRGLTQICSPLYHSEMAMGPVGPVLRGPHSCPRSSFTPMQPILQLWSHQCRPGETSHPTPPLGGLPCQG